ncbi:hypothetical protein [Geomesophilobacter sediminis]|uniref:Uncharacterized protein n=1 Tax=Geomesophilobacter sediminis TaxID=2798584 RepID=A0A8J7IPI3_9BACT|nr:hypothetical protein [Geomesophilobacter sediminis]MBJ6724294.1 hypothetical protein [Geomesophilobacter sediminis]
MNKRLVILAICLCLAACGRSNHGPAPQGLSDSGNYLLGSARSTSSSGAVVFADYTGMTGRLSLSGGNWNKRIIYRGFSTTTGGTFTYQSLNPTIGTFRMYSSTMSGKFVNGGYTIGASSALTLQYDADSTGAALTENWIKN